MATTTEKGEETRERILRAARDLFVERGYEGTSMAQILSAAGITKGGFYFHFPSKAALAAAVMESAKAQINAQIMSAAEGTRALPDLIAIARRAFQACDAPSLAAARRLSHELADSGHANDAMGIHSRQWAHMVEELIAKAQAEGDVGPEVDAHSASVVIMSAYFGLVEMGASLEGGAGRYEEQFLRMALAVLGVPSGET